MQPWRPTGPQRGWGWITLKVPSNTTHSMTLNSSRSADFGSASFWTSTSQPAAALEKTPSGHLTNNYPSQKKYSREDEGRKGTFPSCRGNTEMFRDSRYRKEADAFRMFSNYYSTILVTKIPWYFNANVILAVQNHHMYKTEKGVVHLKKSN